VLIVRSTPQWARKIAGTGPSCGPIAQNKLGAFGNFMKALVVRYSGAPYNVKYWELWNEPDIDATQFSGDNIYGCWGDASDAYYGGGYYAEMLKVAYPQIKSANAQAQVLVGGLLLDCDPRGTPSACAIQYPANPNGDRPPKFLEGILRNGGGAYFDGISFHGYDFYDYVDWSGSFGQYGNGAWKSTWNSTGPVTIAKVNFLKSVLSSYSVTGKYLMNTEVALACGDANGSQSYCKTTDFETTKAYYVVQSYAVGIAEGLRANIWYSVQGWRNSELLDYLTPTLAYTAFRFARSELGDAGYMGEISAAEVGGVTGVKGYEFQRGDHRIWVLWSLDGNNHTISFSGATPDAVWDALGVSVTPASSMNLTLKPLYLEWQP
jgi:hypothetical protein